MGGFIIQVINYTQVAINESQRDYKEFPPLILGYMVWRKWQVKVRMLSQECIENDKLRSLGNA